MQVYKIHGWPALLASGVEKECKFVLEINKDQDLEWMEPELALPAGWLSHIIPNWAKINK